MLSTDSPPPTSENVHPRTAVAPFAAKFFLREILCYTGNAIFVVVALAMLDWLHNATPASLTLNLRTSNEPSIFSVAVENRCLVNGIFGVCLSDARRHR